MLATRRGFPATILVLKEENKSAILGLYKSMQGQRWSAAQAQGAFTQVAALHPAAAFVEQLEIIAKAKGVATPADYQVWKNVTAFCCRVGIRLNQNGSLVVESREDRAPFAVLHQGDISKGLAASIGLFISTDGSGMLRPAVAGDANVFDDFKTYTQADAMQHFEHAESHLAGSCGCDRPATTPAEKKPGLMGRLFG